MCAWPISFIADLGKIQVYSYRVLSMYMTSDSFIGRIVDKVTGEDEEESESCCCEMSIEEVDKSDTDD